MNTQDMIQTRPQERDFDLQHHSKLVVTSEWQQSRLDNLQTLLDEEQDVMAESEEFVLRNAGREKVLVKSCDAFC